MKRRRRRNKENEQPQAPGHAGGDPAGNSSTKKKKRPWSTGAVNDTYSSIRKKKNYCQIKYFIVFFLTSLNNKKCAVLW